MTAAMRRSLYREHLEEAACLHEYRQAALEDPELSSAALAHVEARLEAHLDGLVLGGDLAWDVAATRALEGPGEVYAAARLACLADRSGRLLAAVEAVDWGAPALRGAVIEALIHALPAAWDAHLHAWLGDGSLPGAFKAALARAAGARRRPLGAAIAAAASRLSGIDLEACLGALGELREPSAAMLCFRAMQQPDEALARAGALAALRLRSPEALPFLRSQLATRGWAAIPLALADAQSAAPLLRDLVRERPSCDAVLALGIIGDRGATEILAALLRDPSWAPEAALALHLITGEAPLAPAGVEREDEPQPHPRGWRPAGGLALSEAAWRSLAERSATPGTPRRRFGAPLSPAGTLRALASRRLPFGLRRALATELVLSEAIDLAYDPEQLVAAQREILGGAQAAAAARV